MTVLPATSMTGVSVGASPGASAPACTIVSRSMMRLAPSIGRVPVPSMSRAFLRWVRMPPLL